MPQDTSSHTHVNTHLLTWSRNQGYGASLLARGRPRCGRRGGGRGGGHGRGQDGQGPPTKVLKPKPPRISYKDGGSPTWSTQDTLMRMINLCHLTLLVFKLPEQHERPWTPPAGYICLYEGFFTHCRLWFPLHELFVRYCREEASIYADFPEYNQNMVAGYVLAAECGFEMDHHF